MSHLPPTPPESAQRAVLITGCSSGIGYATAVHLAQHGFTVLATVRKERDAERLRALGLPDLIPICPLDLTCPDHLPGVVAGVRDELDRRGLAGLHALIQNAGGGAIAPVELMDLGGFRTELETRLVGATALVQSFLPLIRAARGRIVWIVTPAIIPTPYVASIHAADFAVNCLVRTLSIELKPWDIPTIMIRCGGIQTESVERSSAGLASALEAWPADRRALYADRLREWQASMASFDAQRTAPQEVARLIHTALTARKPRSRYSIGHMARAAAFREALPQPLSDWILKMRF